MRRFLASFAALSLILTGPARAQIAPAGARPAAQPAAATPAPIAGSFKVTFDAALQPGPYTGRVYIALGKRIKPEPRVVVGNWFTNTQVFAMDVKDLPPGGTVAIGESALGFPKTLKDAKAGEIYAQAFARRNLDSPNPGKGEGDLYSEPVRIDFRPGADSPLELKLTKAVAAEPFPETDRIKLVEIDSPLLSKFYGRPVKTRAGVILPKAYKDDPAQHYKTLYFIGGFGGDHRSARGMVTMFDAAGDDVLTVVPDPTCFLGHSVFADSANNGPRGQSLMEELIPAVEAKYHGAGSGERRYVSGISSGGWSCLWLQITYPDAFAGCWSHCPDPVDFHDFQRIDLYAPGVNMYKDPQGARRPLARIGREESGAEHVSLWYDEFVHQETVMGPGGQIHSFEGVFSPRGPDGKPVPLFDRETGNVNTDTAKAWEKYDIRLIVERDWATLGPKLKGKLHIYAGGSDTFYLDGAAKLLKATLERLGSDAEFDIIPNMSHTIHGPGMQAMFATIAGRPAAQPAPAAAPPAAK